MIFFCFIVQIGLLVLDGWFVIVLPERPLFALSGHFFASLFFSLSYGRSLNSLFPHRKASLLGGLLALLIPGVGIGCALMVALLRVFKPLPPGDLLKEFEKYTNEADINVEKKKTLSMNTEFLQCTHKVQPFRDLLSTPNTHMKQSVLEAIVKRNNPRLFPLILAALEDPRMEIHQFAISMIQRLRHEYEMKIIKAVEAIEALPKSIEAHYRLALAYCQYMESGLMDKSTVRFFMSQFQKEYRKILTFPHTPTEEHILSNLGQLSLKMKRWHEAEAAFGKALELRPNSIDANMGFIKLYYERKMYNKTLEGINRIRDVIASNSKITSRTNELARCWLSPHREIKRIINE